MMDTGHFARPDDIFEYSICFKKKMFAVSDLYLFANEGIDEWQVGQTTVEEVR